MPKEKKKPKSYWNYRILTRIVTIDKYKVKGDKSSHKEWREFFIAEVYYRNGEPSSYKDSNPLSGWDVLKDLKWTAKHIKDSLKKPVLDINNWPKKWNKKKEK
jgi:hypothetical protein